MKELLFETTYAQIRFFNIFVIPNTIARRRRKTTIVIEDGRQGVVIDPLPHPFFFSIRRPTMESATTKPSKTEAGLWAWEFRELLELRNRQC